MWEISYISKLQLSNTCKVNNFEIYFNFITKLIHLDLQINELVSNASEAVSYLCINGLDVTQTFALAKVAIISGVF